MKLYMHPVSTTSRPVMMTIEELKLPCEYVVVDLMKGEHHQEPFIALNPSRQVPVLVDGDFAMTESSAIMKYLCDKVGSPLYPSDLQARARVNERMDWLNTLLYRDFGYNLIYPQIFAHHKRPGDGVNEGVVGWGKDKAVTALTLLNDTMLGDKPYLAGDTLTIADIFGACIVSLGDVVRVNFDAYPKVKAWLGRVQQLPSWSKHYETLGGFAASLKDQPLVSC